MSIVTDPLTANVSAITQAWDATMVFLGGALPPTENRLAAFKIRSPKLYQRVRLRMEEKLYDTIKSEMSHSKVTYSVIVAYVQDVDDDLPQSEQNSLVQVLCDRFGIAYTPVTFNMDSLKPKA